MEVLSLCSPPGAAQLPSSSWRRALLQKSASGPSRSIAFPRKRSSLDGNPRFLDFRPRASGSTFSANLSNAEAVKAVKQEANSKDKDLAFVAGATGRVGSRLVRELLKLGFRVRAGVRSAQRAEPLVQSVRQMKLDIGSETSGTEPIERLEIVECDLEKQGGIGSAIGNASVVLCCIGASEKEISDITGPYRIDYKATENLIKAATVAKVGHFILLTSLGTSKIGFPAAILNLFWGVLIWKRKAEEALIASGLPYAIVRPGGMERPTDSFKETHNLVLADEDTFFGGLVSNLQVAELMAFMAKNKKLSYCKVVEVIAETTAPLLPMEELLAKIPSKREPPVEIVVDLATSSAESKPTKAEVQEIPEKIQVPKTRRPLSPFAMYDDLKPPTSPTPTPSSTTGNSNQKEVEFVQTKSAPDSTLVSSSTTLSEDVSEKKARQDLAQTLRPISPYAAYEDLKSPSSPSQTPSTAPTNTQESAKDDLPVESNTVNGPATSNQVIPDMQVSNEAPNSKSNYRSPFPMYDDLKPPTSPTPSSPK